MSDGHSDWEKLVLDNFAPDVMLGRRPHGKRVWLVVVNERPRPQPPRPPPGLVLIRGGRQD